MTLARTAPPVIPAAGRRYTATAQALHWVSAALVFVVLPLAWVMVSLGPGAPSRGSPHAIR